MKGSDLIANTLEKKTNELKSVIKDAQKLLKTAKEPEKVTLKLARARFESTLKNAKDEMLDLERDVVGRVKGAAHVTGEYVKDHAWNVAGAGACVGLLVGILVARGNHGTGHHAH